MAPAKNPFAKLVESRPKDFGIGNNIKPAKDLTRFVRWPRYIRLQRQHQILKTRLKVPPMINQFSKTLPKPIATQVFRMAGKYKPENKQEKRERIRALAALRAEGKTAEAEKPIVLKHGINHVASLVMGKRGQKAKLVLIAHDVDPIELVMWLPTLCNKCGVPYCIVKGKAALGQLIGMKNATCVAFTDIKEKDRREFASLLEVIEANVDYTT
eukprot:g7350.t1